MTVTHTKNAWWEYYPETNIAGGPAGAAYATTAPSGAAELNPCNYPFNEEQTFPMAEYITEAVEAPGQDISTKQSFTKGLKIHPGKLVQYMQSDTWIEWAFGIGEAPAGTSDNGGGALPETFLLHYDTGDNEFTAYGCHITEYTLEGSKGEYVKESVSFNAYDVQDEDVAGDAAPFVTTAVANFEDVGVTALSIDAVAVTDVESIKLTVTNTYVENAANGVYFHKYPYLIKRDVEIEMEFLTYEEHLDDLLTENGFTDPIDIIVNNFGFSYFKATNMKIKPESVNINTVPEKGMKKYKVTYEIGGASVFTFAA